MSTMTGIFAVFLAAFPACLVAVAGDGDPCPSTEMTSVPMVTSYLSVDGGGSLQCRLQYTVVADATLYQGMEAVEQQHPDFQFTSTVHEMYGHFIETINNVVPENNSNWFIYDNATKMTTPVGVDFIKVANDSSYIWHFTEYISHNMTYTGPCLDSPPIAPVTPINYQVLYLTVYSAQSMNFEPVCKQPVLFMPGPISVYQSLEIANEQIPISVKAVLNPQNNTVTSFNGVPNNRAYQWVGYKAGMMIPYDLSMTTVTNGDHITFLFEDTADVDRPENGAPSGRSIALLAQLAGLLTYAVTSV